MILPVINMHEINAYYIEFYWKFSHLSREIKRNVLSSKLFGSEMDYYNIIVKIYVFTNCTSKYQLFHCILSRLKHTMRKYIYLSSK